MSSLTISKEFARFQTELVVAKLRFYISMVTYMEVFQGVYRDPARHEKEAQLADLLESIGIALFSEDVARRCAIVREELRQGERQVRHRFLDLITALENDLILVTRNTADYDDVSGHRLHEQPSDTAPE